LEFSHFDLIVKEEDQEVKRQVRYVYHENKAIDEMIAIKLEATQSFEYGIVNDSFKVEFPAEVKEVDKEKITYFPTCKYTFFVYKKPASTILSVFFPMFVLAWVLISIYMGPYDLNARTANIAVVLLAYISFI
jgi:hypothetical protein